MTKKQKEAIKMLEESPSADIQTKTAHSLYSHGLISINGFSKGNLAHLNCSLKKKTIFQKIEASSWLSVRHLEEASSFLQQNVTCR